MRGAGTSRLGPRRIAAALAVIGLGVAGFAFASPTSSQAATYGSQVEVGSGFHYPADVTVDGSGNLFVADTGNQRVVELPAGGGQTVLPFTQLANPMAVAVDSTGGVYVVSFYSGEVREVPSGASADVLVHSGLSTSHDLVFDAADNLYVAVTDYQRIVRYPAGGGDPTDMPFAGLSFPYGIATDTAGNLYVADTENNRVLQLDSGATEAVVLPIGSLDRPTSVAVDHAGNVFVTNVGSGGSPVATAVEYVRATGTTVTLPFVGLHIPTGIAVDALGDVYVADAGNHRVLELPVVASPQTITWTTAPPSQVLSGTSFPVAATATSGLPVAITTSGPCAYAAGVVTTNATGTCTVFADQDGDADWSPAPQISATVGVEAITVTSSVNPSYIGQPVTFNATATKASTTIRFYDGTTLLGSKTTATGSASFMTNKLAVGDHSITASFKVGTAWIGSPVLHQQVLNSYVVLQVTPSKNPSSLGATVTFKVTVTRFAPATGLVTEGTITLRDGLTDLGTLPVHNGSVSFVTNMLSAGSHDITVAYSGSPSDGSGESDPITQTVQ